MIARAVGSSWQTILADLSLILFMVTASALANTSDGPLGAEGNRAAAIAPVPRAVPPALAPSVAPLAPRVAPLAPAIAPAPRAEPVGVWRPGGAHAPTLRQWLGDVAHDPRLRLTITVHYAPGGRDAALAEAARLDRSAGVHGDTARIVVEPGQPAGVNAAVGYDGLDEGASASGTQLAGHGA
jgi:hypothetical protein